MREDWEPMTRLLPVRQQWAAGAVAAGRPHRHGTFNTQQFGRYRKYRATLKYTRWPFNDPVIKPSLDFTMV